MYQYCQENHIEAFDIETNWTQLDLRIEQSLKSEFCDLFSKTQIKKLCFKMFESFDKCDTNLFFSKTYKLLEHIDDAENKKCMSN